MKSRGLIDLYLPTLLAYHIKIALAAIIVQILFNLLWVGEAFVERTLLQLVMLFVQLEIYLYLGRRMFASVKITGWRGYQKSMIGRLALFYLLVLIISTAFVLSISLVDAVANGRAVSAMFNSFIENELKILVLSWLIGVSLGTLFFLFTEWSHTLKREQKLREEKLIFQYETLKNQVNPHFLFNSLNTLSSLITHDVTLAEQFIARFSLIYRYILENRDKDLVPLADELAFVRNYFFLQKIRDGEKISLQVHIADVQGFSILPISLQLLVENAIKHNAATRERPLVIKVWQ